MIVATALTAFEFTGGSLAGKGHGTEEDEFDRRERLRKNFRTPIEETVAQLGEGRGIHPLRLCPSGTNSPFHNDVSAKHNINTGIRGENYEERRRERLKENYGIDVPATAQPAGA